MRRVLAYLFQCYVTGTPPHRGKGRIMRVGLRFLRGYRLKRRMTPGFLMWLTPDDPVAREMWLTGIWEAENSRLVEALLRPGDCFVDVGANIGYFSLLASRLVGALGRVIALEPMPATHRWLRDNIALNDASNVTALQVAAGDREGTLTLSLFPGDSAATASQFMAWRERSAVEVTVPANTLDACLKGLDSACATFIKVDAEGGEYAIMCGGRTTLRDLQPLLMLEVLPALAVAAGWRPQELLDLLAPYGYTFYVHDQGRLRLLNPDQDFPEVASQAHVEVYALKLSVPWHAERLRELSG